MFFILPCVDDIRIVDLRTITCVINPQEILTKDSVTVSVDAVVYHRVSNPLRAVIRVLQLFILMIEMLEIRNILKYLCISDRRLL